jgi:competence protein ComEA
MLRLSAVLLLAGLLAAPVLAMTEDKKRERPLNLNTATLEELAQLPGVGPTIAQRIVRHREKSGPFRKLEELLVVRGISRKKFEKIRPYLTLEPDGEKPPAGE